MWAERVLLLDCLGDMRTKSVSGPSGFSVWTEVFMLPMFALFSEGEDDRQRCGSVRESQEAFGSSVKTPASPSAQHPLFVAVTGVP